MGLQTATDYKVIQYMTQPTLINLHPNEYDKELSYYPFAVNLHRCVGSSNILHAYLVDYVFQMKRNISNCMFLT